MKIRIGLLLLALTLCACAGETSFLGEGFPDMTLAPGTSDALTLQLDAEGSHTGEYDITADVESGDGLTATVDPTQADVDGVVDVVLTVSAADSASDGVVKVQATDGHNPASVSVSVSIQQVQ